MPAEFDSEEAVSFGNELLEDIALIKDMVAEGDLPPGAEEFAEGVEEKVEGIVEWIDTESHVTEKQEKALLGIRAGVDRWLKR